MPSKVVGIVQARMGSTRLPGKSMFPLAGEPLLARVLQRIKKSQLMNEVVLAIPNTSENLTLIEVAEQLEVAVFLGSESNLLDRYYNAAKIYKADYVVRIPADNVVPHGLEIDRIIAHHLRLGRPGFSSNLAQVFNSGYPDGIGAEIFDFSLLEEAWTREVNPDKLEHVHLNFFDYASQQPVDANWCPVSTIDCPPDFARPDIVLDVNTQEQYDLMARMYNDLYPLNSDFNILEIIDWYDNL